MDYNDAGDYEPVQATPAPADDLDAMFDELMDEVEPAAAPAAKADPVLTAPTQADIEGQQERAEQADKLDQREQTRKESEAGNASFMTGFDGDGRQDNTSGLFDAPADASTAPGIARDGVRTTVQTSPNKTWKFDRFADAGEKPGSIKQALQDAVSLTGLDLGLSVEISNELDAFTPMAYDHRTDTVIVNPAFSEAPRWQMAQWMTEEVLHALDSVRPGRMLSASAAAFDLDAQQTIAGEAVTHFADNGPLADWLAYPLAQPGMTKSVIKAELFARLGVIYFGQPELLRRTFPKAYEAYHDTFALGSFAGDGDADQSLSAQVHRARNPFRSAQDSSGQRNDSAAEGGGTASRAERSSDPGLERLYSKLRESFGASRLGGIVQFQRSSTVAPAVSRDNAGLSRTGQAKPPSATADVADGDVIVMFNGKVAESAPPPANAQRTPTQGIPTALAQQITDAIAARWANAPDIVVVADMQDAAIPERVRQEDAKQRSQGASGTPEGFYYGGKAYIVASALNKPADVVRVLFHEVLGHAGLRGVFGDALTPILKQLAALRRADVLARARQYGLVRAGADGKPVVDVKTATDAEVWAAMTPDLKSQAAEEVLAFMAQERPELGYVKRAIAAIRAFLRKNVPGFQQMQLTDAEIINSFILPARAFVERGGKGATRGQVAFQRGQGTADQTMSEAFKRWFGDSKVVDKDGKPLVVYHGTQADFNAFDPDAEPGTFEDDRGLFYFTSSPDEASQYATGDAQASREGGSGGNVMPVYVSMENPFIETYSGDQPLTNHIDDNRYLLDYARGKYGRDGLIVKNTKTGEQLVVASQPTQIKSATGNNGDFDPANPDIRFSRTGSGGAAGVLGRGIDRARDAANAMAGRNDPRAAGMADLSDEQRALLGKIGATRTPTADAIKSATDRAGLKIRQGMLDRFASLKELDEQTLGANFLDTAITNSSWVLAKMSSAGSGALNSMMTVGRIQYNGQQKVIELKGEPNGGLTAVLQKLGPPAELERFFAWVAANRASKLLGEGRENLFTPEEIAAGMALNKGNTEAGKARAALYATAFNDFQKYRDDVLSIAEAAGIISEENRALWRDEFYVPFYRVMDEDAKAGGPGGGKGLSRQEAFKKLKGGRQNLNDLMENTLMNFHHLISASLKNQAAVQAIKNAELAGLANQVPESRRDTQTSTFVLQDGKKVFYQVDDPLVFEAITTLSDPGLNSTAVQVMAAFKRVFTQLTTVTPQFIIANTFRDLLQAASTSPTSMNIGKNLVQGIKSYQDEKIRAEMLTSGGAFSFGHIYSMDADEVRANLRKTVAGAELISNPSMIPGILRKGWAAWDKVIDASENVTRAATYVQNVDQLGKLRAAFEARDVMDFSQHGAWPSVRFMIRVVPFLNARLQGLDKLYRSGLKPSILTAMGKGSDTDKQAAARFATVTGALTVATMALYMANADDEEYQKLEDWQKDTYWFFRIGGNAFFLPKPFEVGAIATLAERTLQQAMDDKATGKLFGERLKDMLMQTFAFNPVPQMFQPIMDIYSNRDAFTGRDIETTGMERMSLGLRARDTTTAPAQALSAATRVLGDKAPFAISPVQADHLIKGYLGSVGASAAGILDTMHRAATGKESPDKRFVEYQPIRRFYRDLDTPVANTRYSTLFYDGLREANRVYADVMELQKLGRTEEARELAVERRGALRMRVALNAQQRKLTEINNRLKEVRRSNNDGAWKRRETDMLNTRRELMTERMGKMIENERAAR